MHTGAHADIVDPRRQCVQSRFLDEEEARDRDDAARELIRADAREHARDNDDHRRDLGRTIDVLPAGCNICRGNNRHGAEE
jgi:hypothetical protein